MDAIKVIVTGDHEDLESRFPAEFGFRGRPIEWISIPVLDFQRLEVSGQDLSDALMPPPDWIVFTSPRAVKFFSQLLLEESLDFPLESQVACIGEKTADVASMDGFTPDFYPTEPGSEKFLEEFEDLISNNSIKPRVLIPMAKNGRLYLAEKLKALGCEVQPLFIYQSTPKKDLLRRLKEEDLKSPALILFTSPLSAEAFLAHYSLPEGLAVGSIGAYTSNYLSERGIKNFKQLPQGDFENIGELLC